MEYEQIAVEAKDGIMTVRLDRPDRMNAYTFRMREEISDRAGPGRTPTTTCAWCVHWERHAPCEAADLEQGAATFNPAGHSR
ncbi:hypothetical protein ACU686_05275 [Yinghuangia aomiensis]